MASFYDRRYNTSYEFRDSGWATPPYSCDHEAVIEAVILPSAIGMNVGMFSAKGIDIFTRHGDQRDLHVDSQELFNCVVAIWHDSNVSFDFNGREISTLDLFGGKKNKNVYREIIHARHDTCEALSYTMIQVFHREIVEAEGLEPLKVCLVFYVLTQYLGQDFIVQINSKCADDYVPIHGYAMANVSKLRVPHQATTGVLKCFLEAANSKSLCGLDPFVFVSLAEGGDGAMDVNTEQQVEPTTSAQAINAVTPDVPDLTCSQRISEFTDDDTHYPMMWKHRDPWLS